MDESGEASTAASPIAEAGPHPRAGWVSTDDGQERMADSDCATARRLGAVATKLCGVRVGGRLVGSGAVYGES